MSIASISSILLSVPQLAFPNAALSNAKTESVAAPAPKDNLINPQISDGKIWETVMGLLNEHNGITTKDRFEAVLNIRFGPATRDRDATTYWFHGLKERHFEARLTIYDKKSKSPLERDLNESHLNWYVGWQDVCVTVNQARASLRSGGWTSPWDKPEVFKESTTHSAVRSLANSTQPSMTAPLSYNFFRQSNEDSGQRDRLPRGAIFSNGNSDDSCVTSIVVLAEP